MTRARRAAALPALVALFALPREASAQASAPFEIQEIPSPDRVVQADIADLDGDGYGDLVWTSVRGLPPEEERELRVHLGGPDGVLAAQPAWRMPLPSGTAAYDLADLDGRPGVELLLLRRNGVSVLSFAGRTPSQRDLVVPAPPTLAAVADERGVDRIPLAHSGIGPGPRVLVPGFGTATLLEASGDVVAQLAVGGRANFLVMPRPGPVVTESEIEIYFDHPRVHVGDVDGDGRADIVTSNRHELRVFRQRPDGSFPAEPDRRLALHRISLADHIRTSGAVHVEPHDFDGDGRMDLLVSDTSGSVLGGDTQIAIYRNRGGTWNLDKPDQVFERKGGIASHEILDLDGDGRDELVLILVPTGVLELVKILLTRSIDAEVTVYRPGRDKPFEESPWQRWKTGTGIDFDTLRTKGFVPTLEADVNGDGRRDLLGPGDGVRLEVRLGDADGYRTRHAAQDLDTGGRIRFGELQGDAFPDFVLYDPRRPGTPIRVGRNRGSWPKLAPVLAPAEAGKPDAR